MTGIEQPLITTVIQHYFPDWEPPPDRSEWVSCKCPWHGDSRPSASVSYINDAFVCFTCGVKGDAFKLIMREEGISYTKALEHAERLSPGSSSEVPRKPGRKSGRRAFGERSEEHTSELQSRENLVC